MFTVAEHVVICLVVTYLLMGLITKIKMHKAKCWLGHTHLTKWEADRCNLNYAKARGAKKGKLTDNFDIRFFKALHPEGQINYLRKKAKIS